MTLSKLPKGKLVLPGDKINAINSGILFFFNMIILNRFTPLTDSSILYCFAIRICYLFSSGWLLSDTKLPEYVPQQIIGSYLAGNLAQMIQCRAYI